MRTLVFWLAVACPVAASAQVVKDGTAFEVNGISCVSHIGPLVVRGCVGAPLEGMSVPLTKGQRVRVGGVTVVLDADATLTVDEN